MKNMKYIIALMISITNFLTTKLISAVVPNVLSLSNEVAKANLRSASVLPYCVDSKGKELVLLAREVGGPDRGAYDAFGGAMDSNEKHPVQTAAREFREETVNLIFKNNKDAQNYIDIDKGNTANIVFNKFKKGAVYITKFDYKTLKNKLVNQFYDAIKKTIKPKYKEKDKLAWVDKKEFEKVISTAKRDIKTKKLILPIKIDAQVIDSNGRIKSKKITLRPCLVSILQPFFKKEKSIYQSKNNRIHIY